MSAESENTGYHVWGLDKAVYGPVELPTLVAWIKDERVFPDTWLFGERLNRWQPAKTFVELQPVFHSGDTTVTRREAAPGASYEPESLRRIRIFGTFNHEQLKKLAEFLTPEKIRQWTAVVKQGDMSDSMYFILEGELRVRTQVSGAEKILATLGIGDFFGDIAFFDRGARSADVIANTDSVVLKLSAGAFDRLCKEAPDLATPFLLGVVKTLSARIRADDKRFTDVIKVISAAR